MRIVVVGATGLIGKVVVEALSGKHEVVPVGHSSGDLRVDITDPESIPALFSKTGRFDALVSAAGGAHFGALAEAGDEAFASSLSDKLMGQINLVRYGIEMINDGGSFTLTSGVLAKEPIPGSSVISLVNAGIEGFARAASLELPRQIRINVVSPPFAVETLEKLGMSEPAGLPVATFVHAYLEAVEGARNGEVLDVRQWQ